MAFDPSLFNSLEVWYDASDTNTVTLVSSAVSQLNDKSANSRDMVQATAANRPTIRSAALNGLDVLDFDGSDDWLQAITFSITAPITYMVICKSDKVTGGAADRSYVFDGYDTTQTSSGRHLFALYGGNVAYNQVYFGSSFSGNSDNPISYEPTVAVICADSGNSRLQINDDETQNVSPGVNSIAEGWVLGGNYLRDQDWLNGWIGEMVAITDRSQHVREMLAGYGATKWGLLKALYNSHPYKVHEVPTNGYGTIVQMSFEGGADGDTSYRERAANQYTVNFFGTADISSDQAKFGSLSAHFPGNLGDYATIGGFDDFKIGPYDFTMECWVYIPSLASNQTIASSRASTSITNEYWILSAQTDGKLSFQSRVNTGTQLFAYSDTGLITANTWHHVCVDRTNGLLRCYVDGSQGASPTNVNDTNNPLDFDDDICLGAFRYSSFQSYGNLYIDEFRLIKGEALHQGTGFTPETTPYAEPVARSSALLNFEGANGDTHTTDESYNFMPVMLRNGAALSTTQAKFGSTSLALDGINDYVNIGAVADYSMDTTDDYTVDFWFYLTGDTPPDGAGNRDATLIYSGQSGASVPGAYAIGIDGDGSTTGTGITYTMVNDANTSYSALYVATITKNTWHHVAMVRSGLELLAFYDGTLVGTTALTGTFTPTYQTRIGSTEVASYQRYFPGYIDAFRWVNGRAVWLDNFTVPATATTGDSVTHGRALLNFEGADAATSTTDEGTYGSTFTFGGDAQIDTAQSKFGSSSLLMDGTNDTVRTTDCDAFFWEDRDFTVHFWVRVAGAGPTGDPHLLDFRPTDVGAGPLLYYDRTTRVVSYFTSNAVRITGTALPLNTWAHVALTRHEGTTRLFIDGTQVGSDYTDADIYVTTAGGIGCRYTATGGDDRSLNGHMDAFEVIAGRALWTSNFTAPTSAPGEPPAVANGVTLSIGTALIAGTAVVLGVGPGATFNIGVAIIAGSATGGAVANGIALYIGASLTAGSAAVPVTVSGVTLNIGASLIAGTAETGGAIANGAVFTAGAALSSGASTGGAAINGFTFGIGAALIAGSVTAAAIINGAAYAAGASLATGSVTVPASGSAATFDAATALAVGGASGAADATGVIWNGELFFLAGTAIGGVGEASYNIGVTLLPGSAQVPALLGGANYAASLTYTTFGATDGQVEIPVTDIPIIVYTPVVVATGVLASTLNISVTANTPQVRAGINTSFATITLSAFAPGISVPCILLPPEPPPTNPVNPGDGTTTPVPPGVTPPTLPILIIIDTSPAQIIGCINNTNPDPVTRLTTEFPSAQEEDGVLDRSTGDIWVYRGAMWVNVGPTPGPTIVDASTIPAYDETIVMVGVTKTKLEVSLIEYDLTEQIAPVGLTVSTTLNVDAETALVIQVPTANITVTGNAGIPNPPEIFVPLPAIGVAGVAPITSTGGGAQMSAALFFIDGEATEASVIRGINAVSVPPARAFTNGIAPVTDVEIEVGVVNIACAAGIPPLVINFIEPYVYMSMEGIAGTIPIDDGSYERTIYPYSSYILSSENYYDPNPGVQISTDYAKFGTSSLTFLDTFEDNTSRKSRISTGPISEPIAANTKYTLEFWLYSPYILEAGVILPFEYTMSQYSPDVLEPGKWSHIALTSDGSTKRFFIDGALITSGSTASTFVHDLLYVPRGITGLYIDEYALTIGACYYNEAFTPRSDQIYAGRPNRVFVPVATCSVQPSVPSIEWGPRMVPVTRIAAEGLAPTLNVRAEPLLLLHFNGSGQEIVNDGTFDFEEFFDVGKEFTVVGGDPVFPNRIISAAAKFGAGGFLLENNNGIITQNQGGILADHPVVFDETADYSLDFWVNLREVNDDIGALEGDGNAIIKLRGAQFSYTTLVMQINLVGNRVFANSNFGDSLVADIPSQINTWININFSKVGSNAYLFVDGQMGDSGSWTGGIFRDYQILDESGDIYIDEIAIFRTFGHTSDYTVRNAELPWPPVDISVPTANILTNGISPYDVRQSGQVNTAATDVAVIPGFAQANYLYSLSYLTFDGNDGDTYVTDYGDGDYGTSSGNYLGLPGWLFEGDGVAISAEQSISGGTSLKLGNGRLVNIRGSNISSGSRLGTDDFTCDFWTYATNLNQADSASVVVIGDFQADFVLIKTKTDGNWYFDTDQTSDQILGSVALNTWTHFAIVRKQNEIKVFKDGTLQATVPSYTSFLSAQNSYNGTPIINGRAISLGSTAINAYEGYIDNWRLIKKALYDANFTPFAGEYIKNPSPNT